MSMSSNAIVIPSPFHRRIIWDDGALESDGWLGLQPIRDLTDLSSNGTLELAIHDCPYEVCLFFGVAKAIVPT